MSALGGLVTEKTFDQIIEWFGISWIYTNGN